MTCVSFSWTCDGGEGAVRKAKIYKLTNYGTINLYYFRKFPLFLSLMFGSQVHCSCFGASLQKVLWHQGFKYQLWWVLTTGVVFCSLSDSTDERCFQFVVSVLIMFCDQFVKNLACLFVLWLRSFTHSWTVFPQHDSHNKCRKIVTRPCIWESSQPHQLPS